MPWPSYGNAYAGIPTVSGTGLETYWHDGTSWVLSPYYAHRDGAWRLISLFPLPADDDPVTPPAVDTTVIALTDLLVGAETLGTANDSVVMQRCLARAFGRTGPAVSITTEYITVDFEGQTYFCEDPVGFTGFKVVIGRANRKMIIDGNVSNPAVKGGTKQITRDGLNSSRWSYVVSSGGPEGDDRVSSGGDGHTTPKYRNRLLFGFTDCSHVTFQNFKHVGPNTALGAGFYYDVQREAQHWCWLVGGRDFRFIDCDISQTFGDVIFSNPYRPAGGGKSDDRYTGNVEVLGGTWRKIGRIYITMNQVRAPDGLVDPDYWKNPGDGTGPFESHDSLPWANDAPSLSGSNYGVVWHGNAAHPFAGLGCKRSLVDIENMNSYAHCCDVIIGADTESTPAVDRTNFRLTGEGGNLISSVNRYGLVNRLKLTRIWRTGPSSMSVRIFGSGDLHGGPETTTINPTMHLVNSVPVPSTIRMTSTSGWPTSGYFEVTIGVLSATPIVIKYTGISGLSFTGCTYHDGETANRPFVQNRQVVARYHHPERPKYTCSTFSMLDCLFDGSNASLFQLHRVQNAVVQRNRANYRASNNELEFSDCPGLDLGPGGGQWGSNDFRSP